MNADRGREQSGLVYVSWAPHCSRSDHTARELGGRSFMVYAAALGSRPATILLKYVVQAWRTLRLLRAERLLTHDWHAAEADAELERLAQEESSR